MKKVGIILLAVLLIFSLSGCSSAGAPKAAVKKALSALQKDDSKKASVYIDYNKIVKKAVSVFGSSYQDQKVKMMLKNLTFKIDSASSTGKAATVKADITNTDMTAIAPEFFNQAVNLAISSANKSEKEKAKEMFNTFSSLMDKNGSRTVTKSVSIQLMKLGGKWQVELSDSLINAILGNIDAATSQPQNTANNGGTEASKATDPSANQGQGTSNSGSGDGSSLAKQLIQDNTNQSTTNGDGTTSNTTSSGNKKDNNTKK